jgi:hypothetical protein
MKLKYWGSMPEDDQAQIDALIAAGAATKLAIEIEYIDVLSAVDRAQADHIIVTPTLDRTEPEPFLRLLAIPNDAKEVLIKIRE